MSPKRDCTFVGHGDTHVACLEDRESAETTGRENLCDVRLARIYVGRDLEVAPLHRLHQHRQPVEDRRTLAATQPPRVTLEQLYILKQGWHCFNQID